MGAEGGKGGGYYWVSDDGILMKMDMIYQTPKQKGQRMVMEMVDLEIGPQDPALDGDQALGYRIGPVREARLSGD